MSLNNRYEEQYARASSVSSVDEGLRSYMNRVYNLMTLALAITAVTGYLVIETGFIKTMFTVNSEGVASPSGLGILFMIAPLIMVFAFSASVYKAKISTVHNIFWLYSVLMGISLSPILLVYTGASVFKTFLITSATFASMSLYGYVTKKDLTSMGSFLIMGLWGVIIAGFVNMFMHSPAVDFVLSVVTVGIFTGLTAYETQTIRRNYDMLAGNSDLRDRAAISGALSLYLNFINIFIHLLRILWR